MIGLSVNDRDFRAELERDLAEAEEDVQDFQGEVAIAVRSACEANSPRRTGDLAKSWAVSAGGPDKNLKEGSDAQAAAVVASARHPSGQGHRLTGVGGPQRTGGVAAQHEISSSAQNSNDTEFDR